MEPLIVIGLAVLAGIAFFLFSRSSSKKSPMILRVAGDKNAFASKQATTRTSDFIIVAFSSVQLKSEAEERPQVFDFAEPKEIDLLSMAANLPDAILTANLPQGRYEWIRLMVDADKCRIMSNGVETPLRIPSGEQTGLKLVSGFTVPENGNADFTVLFDVNKSVTKSPNGEYRLRPTLKLVDNNRPAEPPIDEEGDSE